MELYIHIPFCIQKCAYCDFLSGPADEAAQNRYMEALLKEVELAGERHRHSYGQQSPVVETIFIGGGTPSAIPAEWIARLMEQIRVCFVLAENAEISMEANPGTLTAEKLKIYRQAGINRLSIGLQSTEDEELRLLGRIHTYEEFLENYRLARETGFANINIDLMSALPGQTVASYERTLRRVLTLKPEHISAYSLIIEEGTPFWERYGDEKGAEVLLPGEEADRQMYHLTKTVLAEAGYDRYEISNYAKAGHACRHNVGYWTGVPYLGLGLGASSYYEGQRFSNTREMEEYLEALESDLSAEEEKSGQVLSDAEDQAKDVLAALRRDVQTMTMQDSMEEYMFLGLRLTGGISEEGFQKRFGKTMEEVYGPVLAKMEGQELMMHIVKVGQKGYRENFWQLTDLGLDVSNYILAEFLL